MQVGELQLVSNGAEEDEINGSANVCRKGECVAEWVKSQIGSTGDEGADGDEGGCTDGMHGGRGLVQKTMDGDDENHASSAQCVIHEQTGKLEGDERGEKHGEVGDEKRGVGFPRGKRPVVNFGYGEFVGEAEDGEDGDGGETLAKEKKRGIGGWEAGEEEFVEEGETDGSGDVVEGCEEGEQG